MQVLRKPKVATKWDEGDVYYQLVELGTGKVEATLHLRSWNVGASRANLVHNHGTAKEPKEVRFLTKDDYHAIVWPKRGRHAKKKVR